MNESTISLILFKDLPNFVMEILEYSIFEKKQLANTLDPLMDT